MKVLTLTLVFRLLATAWLVYEVYLEAGPYTAFCIGLISVSVELQTISIKAHLVSIQNITKYLFK